LRPPEYRHFTMGLQFTTPFGSIRNQAVSLTASTPNTFPHLPHATPEPEVLPKASRTNEPHTAEVALD
jgi:hypothetical protein